MTTILQVARYIVSKYGPMTTMKLEKLCYYSQAWALAWDETPLFEEDFQAWANGPVCYDLFCKHRGMFTLQKDFLSEIDIDDLTAAEMETIDSVMDYYGDKDPHWLSELTHKERPWKETRGDLSAGSTCDTVIPKELIQEYYAGIA